MRQTIKDKEYFEFAIEDRSSYIKQFEEHIAANNPAVADWAYVYRQLFSWQLSLFFLKYSMGESASDLKDLALSAIKNYLTAENHQTGNPEAIKLYVGIYNDALRLASLAIIYEAPDLLEQLRSSFEKNKKGNDLLLDVLFVNGLGEGSISKKLCYPKIFGDLLPLAENDKITAEIALKNYLDGWYNKMKKTEWYNLHKQSKVNGASPFYGYWAIEAAAFVKIFKLDGQLFKDYEYFPFGLLEESKP